MANVKIRVIADADNAIKNIQKVMDEGLGADKSLTSLGNTLAKLEARQRKGENVSEEYNKTLAIAEAQFIRTRNAALAAGKGYEGAAKAAEKYKQAFFQAGATDAASIFDVSLREDIQTAGKLQAEQLAEKARKQKAYAEALAEADKEQRKFNEAVERGMILAKNDPAEKLKYEYNQLEKQLRENIEVQVELANSGGKWSTTMQDQKNKAKVLSDRMKELQKEMSKVARTPLNERMQNLVKSFVSAQVVVYGIRKALTFLTNTIKDSAKAAAYAEETYNLFITTFEQVSETAQQTAYKIGNTLGIATSSAQKALGVFGDLLKGYGATDAEALKFAETAAKTTLDIISFKNIVGSTDEVMQSFASGLAGNVENFRKLGYVITQAEIKTLLAKKGLDGLTGSTLQQAMVQARLELVMKKATNALGDMEKTLDSTVNVERRVNEAWIEYKENLGQNVNKVMSPLKRWWLDILETTNKANEAKNRFMKGETTGGIYDLNKASDMQVFESSLQKATGGPMYWKTTGMNSDKAYPLLEQIIRLFNATRSDVETALKHMGWDNYIDSDLFDRLLNVGELNERETADRNAYDIRYSALSSMAQDFQGILDKLSGLSGVELTGDLSNHLLNVSANAQTDASAGLAVRNMKGIVNNAFGEALQGISEADWTEFVSSVDLALGKATEQSGLEGKMGELESLYEMVYNFSLKDGELSDEELDRLQDIITERQKVISQMDDLTEAEKARKQAEADLKALEDEKNKEMETTITQTQGFIDSLNKLNGGSTSANASGYLGKEGFGGITKEGLASIASTAIDDIISSMAEADWSEFVDPIELALEDVTMHGALDSAVSELKTFYSLAYMWAMQDGELNEQEAEQLERIVAIRKEALDQLSEEEKAELAKAQGQELKDFGMESLGDIGTIIEAFSNIGASMGGWIGMLVQLASQLEIVQRIGNTFSETILPVMNQLLEPLMSTLDVLFDVIVEFLAEALQPVYTLIKAIAPMLNTVLELLRPLFTILNVLQPVLDLVVKTVALIAGIINGVIKFISDTLKWFAGWIMKGLLGFVNGCIWLLNKIPFVHINYVDTSKYDEWTSNNPLDSFQKGFDEVQNAINKGNGLLDDIKNNTDNSSDERLKYLAELYKNGILSSQEYYAQRSSITGENWDRTKFFSKGTYYNANGYTVARYGDVTINIQGTNLSAEEVTEAIEKALRPGAKSFQMAI